MGQNYHLPLYQKMMRVMGMDPEKIPDTPEGKAFNKLLSRYDAPVMALHSPVAPQTWEVQTTMLATDEQTPRVPLRFPASLIVTGFYPSIRFTNFVAGGPQPSLDDVRVILDIDDAQKRMTVQQGLGTATGGGFVTLASIGVLVPRLLMLMLSSPNPELGFTFRSKYAGPGSSGLGADVFIDVAIFVEPIGF